MAITSIARYEIRPDARDAAERAMHDHASFVRRELRDVSWSAYRDPAAPTRFIAVTHAESPAAEDRHRKALLAALAEHVTGAIEVSSAELVTSSDLQRRHRR